MNVVRRRTMYLLREERGAELAEWIGWMAVVMIALAAFGATYWASAPQIARTISCEVGQWTAKWSGRSDGGGL